MLVNLDQVAVVSDNIGLVGGVIAALLVTALLVAALLIAALLIATLLIATLLIAALLIATLLIAALLVAGLLHRLRLFNNRAAVGTEMLFMSVASSHAFSKSPLVEISVPTPRERIPEPTSEAAPIVAAVPTLTILDPE